MNLIELRHIGDSRMGRHNQTHLEEDSGALPFLAHRKISSSMINQHDQSAWTFLSFKKPIFKSSGTTPGTPDTKLVILPGLHTSRLLPPESPAQHHFDLPASDYEWLICCTSGSWKITFTKPWRQNIVPVTRWSWVPLKWRGKSSLSSEDGKWGVAWRLCLWRCLFR